MEQYPHYPILSLRFMPHTCVDFILYEKIFFINLLLHIYNSVIGADIAIVL